MRKKAIRMFLVLALLGMIVGCADTSDFIETLKNAIAGDSNAQKNHGLMYEEDEDADRDCKKPVELYARKADQGYARAQTCLGRKYLTGHGVARDYEKAFEWFAKAADQGDAMAQVNIGFMYDEGKGVPRDYNKAFGWFARAADQGYAPAQTILGGKYFIDDDYEEAFGWFARAADQGYARAQCMLGLMYHHGIAVTQDYVQAYKLYNLAAAQGDEDAIKNRDSLLKNMTPAQIVEGQRLSRKAMEKMKKRKRVPFY